MKLCHFCGKEVAVTAKFCNYCGKQLDGNKEVKQHNKTKLKHHITLSIFLIIIFIIVILIIIISLKQKNVEIKKNDITLTLPEEKVIDISEQVKEIKRFEEKRKEGYNLDDKPFESGDYSYDERTVDFRLVCERNCPVSKNVLDQEFAAIAYAVSTLRGLTKSDINKELLPFEVHASEDSRCPLLQGAAAYKTLYTDSNGYTRGLLCFFYDKINYDRTKFPYSTSIHEVTHLFEHGKYKANSVIDEGLSEMLESFFLKGNNKNSFCWQGNAWYKQVLKNSDDPHWVGGDLFFELCNQYGFDYDNLPELFRQFGIRNGNVDEKEFVKIINGIVGKDASSLFRNAGVVE